MKNMKAELIIDGTSNGMHFDAHKVEIPVGVALSLNVGDRVVFPAETEDGFADAKVNRRVIFLTDNLVSVVCDATE